MDQYHRLRLRKSNLKLQASNYKWKKQLLVGPHGPKYFYPDREVLLGSKLIPGSIISFVQAQMNYTYKPILSLNFLFPVS